MVPPAKRLRKSVDKLSRHSPQARQIPAQGTVEVSQLKSVVDGIIFEAMRNYVAELEERTKGQDARIVEQEARLKEQAERLELHEKIDDLRFDGLRGRHEKQEARLEEQYDLIEHGAGDVRRPTQKVDEFEDWIWERFMGFQDSTDRAITQVFQALMTVSMTVTMRLMS